MSWSTWPNPMRAATLPISRNHSPLERRVPRGDEPALLAVLLRSCFIRLETI